MLVQTCWPVKDHFLLGGSESIMQACPTWACQMQHRSWHCRSQVAAGTRGLHACVMHTHADTRTHPPLKPHLSPECVISFLPWRWPVCSHCFHLSKGFQAFGGFFSGSLTSVSGLTFLFLQPVTSIKMCPA